MRPVEIVINSRGNLAAIDQAKKACEDFKSSLNNIAGISIGVGIERAVEGIKSAFVEVGREVIGFMRQMETAQYSIAAMQRQFAPGKFKDFQSALKGSAEVLDVVKKKADEMNVGIEDAVETYKTSAGAMFAGGVKDLTKQVDLALMLQQAMRGLGVQGFQATRDIQDILSGRSHMTKAGRELGLSDEDIKRAEEAGTLYEFLNEKLGSYAEAGKAAGNTLNAEMIKFENTVLTIGADLAQPMFEEMKAGVASLLTELKKPEFRESLRPLGDAAKEVAQEFFAGTKFASEHAHAIMQITEAFGALLAATLAWKGAKLVEGLAALAMRWVSETSLIWADTAALKANAEAAAMASAAKTRAVSLWGAEKVAGGAMGAGEAALGTAGTVMGVAMGTAVVAAMIPVLKPMGTGIGTAIGNSGADVVWRPGRPERLQDIVRDVVPQRQAKPSRRRAHGLRKHRLNIGDGLFSDFHRNRLEERGIGIVGESDALVAHCLVLSASMASRSSALDPTGGS